MKIFYGVSFTHGLSILVVPSKKKIIIKEKLMTRIDNHIYSILYYTLR